LCAAVVLGRPGDLLSGTGGFDRAVLSGGIHHRIGKDGDDPQVPPVILGNGLLGAVISPIAYAKLMDGFGDYGLFWLIAIVAAGIGAVSLVQYRAMNL